MPRDDDSFLLDMLLAARDAVSFASGLTYERFAQSQIAKRKDCLAHRRRKEEKPSRLCGFA